MAFKMIASLFILSLLFSCYSGANLLEDPREISGRGSNDALYAGSIGYGRLFKGLSLKNLRRIVAESLAAESPAAESPAASQIVNVDDFGAKGDGESDDTEAFQRAWDEVCSSGDVLAVPEGKSYLLGPITFSGPCKSDNLIIQMYGTLVASDDRSIYKKDPRHWIRFDFIDNLYVDGAGTGIIDGSGKIWWQNSCKINKNNPCVGAPTAVTFYKSNNLRVLNLKVQNAQQMQVSINRCINVEVSNLTVSAPDDSPNTDGIHITGTRQIQITNSIIGTGDDCISIESGSEDVTVKDTKCGPGHGISIGSLGDDNSEAYVSRITVDGVTFSGTDNGVRIKTWQGGSGSASNIHFQNIKMDNVENPIIIDQNYCDQDEPCKEQKSAVQVKGVIYQNIIGTSANEDAIKFDCSKNYPCQGIVLQNIDIENGNATCNNVEYTERGFVSPTCTTNRYQYIL